MSRGRLSFQVFSGSVAGPPWFAQLAAVEDPRTGEWKGWDGPPVKATSLRAMWALRGCIKEYRRQVKMRQVWQCTRCGRTWQEWKKKRRTTRCRVCGAYFEPWPAGRSVYGRWRKLAPCEKGRKVEYFGVHVTPGQVKRNAAALEATRVAMDRFRTIDSHINDFDLYYGDGQHRIRD